MKPTLKDFLSQDVFAKLGRVDDRADEVRSSSISASSTSKAINHDSLESGARSRVPTDEPAKAKLLNEDYDADGQWEVLKHNIDGYREFADARYEAVKKEHFDAERKQGLKDLEKFLEVLEGMEQDDAERKQGPQELEEFMAVPRDPPRAERPQGPLQRAIDSPAPESLLRAMQRVVGTPSRPSTSGTISSLRTMEGDSEDPAEKLPGTQVLPDDISVPIEWRTVTGRRGKAKITGKELQLLQSCDYSEALNFLGLDDSDELLNNVNEEPEFLVIEICLDSGAGDHVLSRVDVPGFVVEESPGSKAGRGFWAANNKRIPNEGQTLLRLKANDGSGMCSTFQVAEVSRPLWSVGKICDQGFTTTFTKTHARITDENGKEILVFERRNGLYLGLVQVRNPKFRPRNDAGFARPSK